MVKIPWVIENNYSLPVRLWYLYLVQYSIQYLVQWAGGALASVRRLLVPSTLRLYGTVLYLIGMFTKILGRFGKIDDSFLIHIVELSTCSTGFQISGRPRGSPRRMTQDQRTRYCTNMYGRYEYSAYEYSTLLAPPFIVPSAYAFFLHLWLADDGRRRLQRGSRQSIDTSHSSSLVYYG